MRTLVLACLLTLFFIPLAAQERGYITMYGGVVKGQDQWHRLFNADSEILTAKAEMKDGLIAGVVAGVEVTCGLRVELESHYQWHDYGSFQVTQVYGASSSTVVDMPNSRASYWSGMLNVYFDFVTPYQVLIPFLGVGAGPGYVKMRVPELLAQITTDIGPGDLISDNKITDVQAAWQLMAGIHLIKDSCYFADVMVRWWEIYPEYRFNINSDYSLRSTAKELSLQGCFGIWW